MIRVRCGEVLSVIEETEHYQRLMVLVEGTENEAVSFPALVGMAKIGDQVTLNTTAVALGLGTGGQHFVMAVADAEKGLSSAGHIMKLRYTPSQVKVLAAEEEASPYHELLKQPTALDDLAVCVATLHSLIAPFSVAFKRQAPSARLVYVMTDGAALPARLSKLAQHLRRQGYLDAIITCGHAFGGDLEAVTVYSALQIAHRVLEAEACIVAMGPGVVGTGTALGTTALEQAPILDGANALGARSMAVPRISFADPRPRHQGLSHHSLTALGLLTHSSTTITLPVLNETQTQTIIAQCRAHRLIPKHRLQWEDIGDVNQLLTEAGVQVTSMGRTPLQDPAFFATGAAAGQAAARWAMSRKHI
ncbi:MAG: DUF3866 family protein [Firmicutes bacterium]|nr:DUF3866 family protein [Bacillota bacterium]